MNKLETDATVLAIERPPQGPVDLLPHLFAGVSLPLPDRGPSVLAGSSSSPCCYRFTDEGISMSWGILLRRETIINYARIQDIHLRSTLIERWLGLAAGFSCKTASGNSAPK
jgi:putative membrane protein